MLRSPGRAVRSLLAAVLALLLAAALLGCSEDAPRGAGDDRSEDDVVAAESVPTRTSIGKVVGRLDERKRRHLQRRVTRTFDSWVAAAYLGDDYPRTDFSDAFGVFTRDARKLAQRDRALLTNAGVGDRLDSVRATARRLRLDVLAPKGTAVGVTARFVLVLDLEGEVQRTDRVVGRLVLGYTRDGWKAFAYDVKRGRAR